MGKFEYSDMSKGEWRAFERGIGVNFFFNGLVAIGIIIGISGVVLAEFFLDFMGVLLEPSEILVATISGAAIALVGTLLTIHAAAEARENERNFEDQAIISEIFVKMQAIVNHLYHFRKHFCDSDVCKESETKPHPSMWFQSLSGHPDPIVFSSKEKAVFLRLKDNELANLTAEWDGIHNSLLRAIQKYSEMREEITSKLPAKMDGLIGTTEMSYDDWVYFEPRFSQLDDLLAQIQKRCVRDFDEAMTALESLSVAMSRYVGISLEMQIPE